MATSMATAGVKVGVRKQPAHRCVCSVDETKQEM